MTGRGAPLWLSALLVACWAGMAHALAEAEAIDATATPEQLVESAERYRLAGRYRLADAQLELALDQAQRMRLAEWVPLVELARAQLALQRGEWEQAQLGLDSLTRTPTGNPLLIASRLTLQADLARQRGNRRAAQNGYRQALAALRDEADAGMRVSILLKLARSLEQTDLIRQQLQLAGSLLAEDMPPPERAGLQLELADLWQTLPGQGQCRSPEVARRLLQQAHETAQGTEDARLRSLAAGRLGACLEAAGETAAALRWTALAILDGQAVGADDLLLRWEWQLGRLSRAQGDQAAALAAYRRAVAHIAAIRQDIPITYQDGKSSFRETLAPIFLGLVDLLLEQSQGADAERAQALLREARATVERIKLSELRDYFQDACLVARSETVEALGDATAVLYPVILPDRLELLLGIGNRLRRYRLEVPSARLERQVARLTRSMRPGPGGVLLKFDRERAGQLYDWLIRPLLPALSEAGVSTLVFVPDGVLRTLPIAALWDGQRYLLERFAIATAPGLTLLDPQPLDRRQMQALIAGLSKPGPVVYDLPAAMWAELAPGLSPTGGARGMPVTVRALASAAGGRGERDASAASRVQQALALPGVRLEVDQLARDLRGQVLLDQEFLLDRFSEDLNEGAYRVVHIASHGFFGGSPQHNFIMTYDRKLDMERLAQLLRGKQLAEVPVELLALSACQTAEGDDRSPLGLSGVAIQSGARSALGSLWPVADDAAQQMFPAFYRALTGAAMSKAEALRQAQLQLLTGDSAVPGAAGEAASQRGRVVSLSTAKGSGAESPAVPESPFAHPYYWAPFILIGNWL
jgi:CHAT domain-containing protein